MSFIRQLVKKLAEKGEPETWSVDKRCTACEVEVSFVYVLSADEIDMLHIIDESEDEPAGAGQ